MKNDKKFNLIRYFVIYSLIASLMFIIVYFGLMPITIISGAFRLTLIIILLLIITPLVVKLRIVYSNTRKTGNLEVFVDKTKIKRYKYFYYFICLIIISFLVMQISTAPIFNTARYRDLLTVTESEDFASNITDLSQTKVPIVDKSLAFRLGDKKLGEYKGLGSQYTINNYTMIEMNGELYWVGSLEYTGFFKWLSNKNEGVPGYIKISATNPSQVTFVNYKMKYVPSAYFSQDLNRKIYFSNNMNKLFSDYIAFELDDEGNPYFIKTVITKKFALSGGEDAIGVVVLNAATGESKYYDIADAPKWIDRIQPTNIIIDQLGYYGKYVHGFLNTLFAKKEVLQVSEGYSYIYNNGNFYLYTGLTSVGSDESIVGITLTDMRSKETTFYRIGGATEYSAQNSAQGAVQDLGYKANWPILVNFQNVPTYFMTLKDEEGLIKKFAYVSVKDYSVVGIGDTLIEAQNNYLKNLRSSNIDPNTSGELKEVTAKVVSIQQVIINGNTFYYLMVESMNDKLFLAPFNVSYELPLTKVDDLVSIKYYETKTNVYTIEKFDNCLLDIE